MCFKIKFLNVLAICQHCCIFVLIYKINIMRVISFKRFDEFAKKHKDSGKQLYLLKKDLKNTEFNNANEVKNYFPYISILKDSRFVFNIHGNKYRLILKFNFKAKIIFVRFIGTHKEYDNIDANLI